MRFFDKFIALIAGRLWRLRGGTALLSMFGWRILKVTQKSREDRGYEVADPSTLWVASGLGELNSTRVIEAKTMRRELGIWRETEARVSLNTKFSAVAVGPELRIHPRFERGPYHLYPTQRLGSSSGIYLQSGDSVLVDPKRNHISLAQAVYCGTRAPHNWGHWLLNFLPGVMLAGEYFGETSAPPLIVPVDYDLTASRVDLFNLFWGGRDVIVVDSSLSISVDELFWFEQPVADSPRSENPRNLELKAVHVSAITRFRERVIGSIDTGLAQTEHNSSVFLAREFGRRDYNQDAVHRVAQELGYRVVYFDRLSIHEQLRTILGARRIAGPIGSAFANILFASSGAKALAFARREHVADNSWWSSFAHVAGVELAAFYIKGIDDNQWEISPQEAHYALSELKK